MSANELQSKIDLLQVENYTLKNRVTKFNEESKNLFLTGILYGLVAGTLVGTITVYVLFNHL